MHVVPGLKVLYFGTPVVLISTVNPDGTANLAPMSSAWWLGQSAMLGMGDRSQTAANLRRHGECVLNLPSSAMAGAVDRIALTTGRVEVSAGKRAQGYRHVATSLRWVGSPGSGPRWSIRRGWRNARSSWSAG